jgi:hypothetical protein
MLGEWKFSNNVRFIKNVRRAAEYAVAIGIALLCGYGIVRWR